MQIESHGVDHVYLSVRDMRRSEAFYDHLLVRLLGYRKSESVIGGDEHLHYHDRHHGLSLRPARPGTPAHDGYAPGLHHLCLRVGPARDVDRIAQALHDAGLHPTGAADYPEYAPDYRATFVIDPDGIRLEVTNFRQERRRRMHGWVADATPPALHVAQELWLRPGNPGHAEALFAIVDTHRADLRTYLPWVDDTTEAAHVHGFLQASSEQAMRGEAAVFVVEHNASPAGVCGFNRIHRPNSQAEVGYWLRPELRRRGIMSACVRRLLQHAFDDEKLHRITLDACTENVASRTLAERIGFRQEGVSRQAEWVNDRFVDHARYAILRSEFQGA